MSVQRIIQESIEKNPLGLKEAFAEELSTRIRLALEEKMSEEDSDEIYLEAAQYLLDENIEVSDLSEEQLDELLGSMIKGAARLAKRAVVNKKGNFRFSTAGKADAAQAAVQRIKKQEADRKRLEKARADLQRLRTRT